MSLCALYDNFVLCLGFTMRIIPKCKNSNHTSLFHCINICQVPWKIFEHSACGLVLIILPRDLIFVNALNAWKKCVLPILIHYTVSNDCESRQCRPSFNVWMCRLIWGFTVYIGSEDTISVGGIHMTKWQSAQSLLLFLAQHQVGFFRISRFIPDGICSNKA